MPHRFQGSPVVPAALRPATPTTPDLEEPGIDIKFKPTYQNTYRLEPKRPWVEELVVAVIKEVMFELLEAVEYDATKCSELASTVANEIRTRVREFNFDRCKIACVVDIYEKLFQGIHVQAGYLWDAQRDHFATFSFSNTHIIATGTVFGIYYE